MITSTGLERPSGKPGKAKRGKIVEISIPLSYSRSKAPSPEDEREAATYNPETITTYPFEGPTPSKRWSASQGLEQQVARSYPQKQGLLPTPMFVVPDTPPDSPEQSEPLLEEISEDDLPNSAPASPKRVIFGGRWSQQGPEDLPTDLSRQDVTLAVPIDMRANVALQPHISVKLIPLPEEILRDIRKEYTDRGPVLTNILLNYSVKSLEADKALEELRKNMN